MQITPEMIDAMYDGCCTRDADRDKLERAWPLIRAQVAKLESDLKSSEEAYEAIYAKFDGCPHKPIEHGEVSACGCSHDHLSDVCAYHAPALRKAQEDLARSEGTIHNLEEALAQRTREYEVEVDKVIALEKQLDAARLIADDIAQELRRMQK